MKLIMYSFPPSCHHFGLITWCPDFTGLNATISERHMSSACVKESGAVGQIILSSEHEANEISAIVFGGKLEYS
jgi:hypothetical protein